MDGPPPPPPPHGQNPKSSSGLPPGKYDIFIIPEHSSGSGFLYLPSLKTNVNSFAAGFASALLLVLVSHALAPAILAWWNSVKGAGGAGMLMLVIAVGVGAWALGRIQMDGGPGLGGGGTGPQWWGPTGGSGPNGHANSHAGPPPSYGSGPTPGAGPMPGTGAPPPGTGGAGQRSQWQRPPPGSTHASGANPGPSPGPQPSTPGGGTAGESARSAWEKAREDTKRKAEEQRAREAEKRRMEAKRLEEEALEKRRKEEEALEKRRMETKRLEEEALEKRRKEEEALEKKRKDIEAMEKRLKEAREKEAKERAAREEKKKYEDAKERIRKELEERRKKDEEAKERIRKDEEAKERILKELEEKRKKDEALREQMRKDTEARAAKRAEEENKPRGSMYAFSAVGEKTNPWPQGRPATPPRTTPVSPPKKPPPPTAKTYKATEEDTYSYRPYDKPKKPAHQKSPSSVYSESSYAASHTTSATTPPPSRREPYSTKDPGKIVIKAVYAFNNSFNKTPTSQLVSGVGSVTDGLVLRFETEGLFIDDDVRHVPQREWDVKAWTLKLVEVWCPSFRHSSASASARAPFASNLSSKHNPIRRLWGLDKDKPASAEETDALIAEMLQLCSTNCRFNPASSSTSSSTSYTDSAYGSSYSSSPLNDKNANKKVNFQTGELKNKKLHIVRATIRDPEGKKFLFIIGEEEAWKVAVGIQRLRKGSLTRSLGVSGMSTGDARSTLESLGWG
ncbi:hypothetical protein BDZ45DRAFT_89086 [Acephala macrosclerotiorum]|nr:hypothetical protein BDZ45DRAFT_89086 [Acephala macrosclerotiorum]